MLLIELSVSIYVVMFIRVLGVKSIVLTNTALGPRQLFVAGNNQKFLLIRRHDYLNRCGERLTHWQ